MIPGRRTTAIQAFPSYLHLNLSAFHNGESTTSLDPPLLTECLHQATGVPVSPDCLKAYQEIKLGKKIKYIIFSLNPTSTEIIVVKKSPDTDYETFLKDLPETEPRWAVYDFQYEAEGGGQRNKLVFISWCVT